VLRRMLGPKKEEVTGGWRMLPKLVFFSRYYQNDQFKECEICKACSIHGEEMDAYRVPVGKPEGKRSLEKN
jgi:hypothetical protein